MKVITIFSFMLLVASGLIAQRTREGPYDIIVRDDKEPLIASFQSKTGSYGVVACGQYGFGSGGNANIETLGCITQITFDFKWGGDDDLSFHPLDRPKETLTVKAGDILHGLFTIDTCAKTATGTIRDETRNVDVMNLIDTNITDNKEHCGPPTPDR